MALSLHRIYSRSDLTFGRSFDVSTENLNVRFLGAEAAVLFRSDRVIRITYRSSLRRYNRFTLPFTE